MSNSEKFVRYLEYYQRKDIEAVSGMFAQDIHLRDWKISVYGKDAAVYETQNNFDNAYNLEIEVLSLMENENCVSGELKIVVNDQETLFVVDVITFNVEGLISSIHAYVGRDD